MEIIKNKSGNQLTLELVGRLDTNTAPQVEQIMSSEFAGVEELIYDFAKLDYISSAGLRVMLASHKIMAKQGKMTIKNVQDTVYEIFEITGLADVMNIEK